MTWTTALSMITDDCVFEATGPAPDGVQHKGRDEIREAWQPIFADTDSRFEVEESLASRRPGCRALGVQLERRAHPRRRPVQGPRRQGLREARLREGLTMTTDRHRRVAPQCARRDTAIRGRHRRRPMGRCRRHAKAGPCASSSTTSSPATCGPPQLGSGRTIADVGSDARRRHAGRRPGRGVRPFGEVGGGRLRGAGCARRAVCCLVRPRARFGVRRPPLHRRVDPRMGSGVGDRAADAISIRSSSMPVGRCVRPQLALAAGQRRVRRRAGVAQRRRAIRRRSLLERTWPTALMDQAQSIRLGSRRGQPLRRRRRSRSSGALSSRARQRADRADLGDVPDRRHRPMRTAISQAVTDLKVAAGRVIKGHKIGLTSKAMRSLTNATEPDYGTMFDNWFVMEGSVVPRSTMNRPLVEVELAFVLKEPLVGPGRQRRRRHPGDRFRAAAHRDRRHPPGRAAGPTR